MKRLGAMLLGLGVLIALDISLVDVRTDAGAILASDALELNALDTSVGRELIIALVSPDQTKRTESARDVADMLTLDPAVTLVNPGPNVVSEDFLDWVWENRFRLALPQDDDLTVGGLSQHLEQARLSLSGANGMIFGDRLLRDPTGSFSDLLQRLDDAASALAQYEGIWQSRDGQAALLFVTLADRDFETGEIAALTDRIRGQVAVDVAVYLLGPRVISAEISAETERESTRVALIASALLLAWLLWAFRSLRILVLAILPLSCGFAAACLMVQLLFGSVHVLALGFGGVLTGLALDYSLHLLGHSGAARPEAKRLVLLGALTTAVGFLAMLGSGVLALMETGVFVATGLLIAAMLSRFIPADETLKLRAPPIERLAWHLPFRQWIEPLLLIAGIIVLAGTSANDPRSLFEPPEHVVTTIEKFSTMVALPSGRYAVLVEGASLSELLVRQTALAGTLDAAVGAHEIDRYSMLSQFLPVAATLPDLADHLPSIDVFRQTAANAMQDSGMAPEFVDTQVEEYRIALQAPMITVADLETFQETQRLAAGLEKTPDGWREIVRLFGLKDVSSLAEDIAARAIPGVEFVDLAAPIETGIKALRRQVLLWLGIGAVAAFGVLAIGHTDWRRAAAVAQTTGAAVGLTAMLMTLFTGALGIFEIVALTLVFGIGIDYGLFLDRTVSPDSRVANFRSVGLCAISTLIAFSIMAISSVKILHEIGLTVFLGVLIMLLLHSGRTYRPRVMEK